MTKLAKFWHGFISFFTLPECPDRWGRDGYTKPPTTLKPEAEAEKVVKYRKPRRRVKSKPKPPTRKR